MAIDPQASGLNETIQSVNPFVLDLLSNRGRASFPKKGDSLSIRPSRGLRDQCNHRHCARRRWCAHDARIAQEHG